ncbi:MAG: phosphotransferase [Gammaproteobacteria bacterium]|nr:phosphotransferase [Gammaproteobacteria bacterium]
MNDWISGIDEVAGCEPKPASSDASFRRYFRLQTSHASFIAMDAPPTAEDCLPFVRIAGYLEAMQLTAPRIIEADIENGFLLLSDLGSEQYLSRLQSHPERAEVLYADAIEALLCMQRRGAAYQASLPPYDEDLLRFELALFRDWLCGTHLNLNFSDADERHWQACCDVLVDNAMRQPQVFVHRDYHSRNLMVMEQGNPGILDFQDAVEGPMTYDLVSLLKDCYVRWPAEQVRQWALTYYQKLSEATRQQVDEQQFFRNFELMGVQRQLKAAGIFCRLSHRDGKTAYLNDVPRTLSYIVELGSRYEELSFLVPLIRDRILPLWGDAE